MQDMEISFLNLQLIDKILKLSTLNLMFNYFHRLTTPEFETPSIPWKHFIVIVKLQLNYLRLDSFFSYSLACKLKSLKCA